MPKNKRHVILYYINIKVLFCVYTFSFVLAIQLLMLDNNSTIGARLKYTLKDMNLNGLNINPMAGV